MRSLSPRQAYSNNLVDHHLVLDLVPPLAHAYFAGRLPAPLSYSQAAILACVGLQQHDIGKVRRRTRRLGSLPPHAVGGTLPRPLAAMPGFSTPVQLRCCPGLDTCAQHPLSPFPLAPSLQLEETLELPSSQALALFNKAIRRLHGLLRAAKEAEV